MPHKLSSESSTIHARTHMHTHTKLYHICTLICVLCDAVQSKSVIHLWKPRRVSVPVSLQYIRSVERPWLETTSPSMKSSAVRRRMRVSSSSRGRWRRRAASNDRATDVPITNTNLQRPCLHYMHTHQSTPLL